MRIALLVATALLSRYCLALSPAEIFAEVSTSVVVVKTYSYTGISVGTGSGVVLRPGVVVTNCHVLQDASRYVVQREGIQAPAALLRADMSRDLCLLRVRSGSPFDRAISGIVIPRDVAIGSDVYAIGAPHGLELTMSRGIVSSLRRFKDGVVVIQTDAAISPGSSGGGLFDTAGQLVGITTFQMKDGQNLNFALPANWVLDLLASAGLPFQGRPSSMTLEELQQLIDETARERERRIQSAEASERGKQERANRIALERQMRAAEEQRLARERTEAARRAALEATQADGRQVQEYSLRIAIAIRSKVTVPPGVDGNAKAEFEISVARSGVVASSRMVTSSGNPAYDAAIVRAIELAQPLPVPSDPELFQRVSELRLVFRPREGTSYSEAGDPSFTEAPISRAPPVQISPSR